MSIQEIQKQAQNIISARFKERQEILKEVIEQIKHEAEVKGILQSKVTYNAICDLCEREVDIRVLITGNILKEVHATSFSAITDEVADTLKQAIREYIPHIVAEMQLVFSEAVELTGQKSIESFDDAVNNALEKVDAQIESGTGQ